MVCYTDIPPEPDGLTGKMLLCSVLLSLGSFALGKTVLHSVRLSYTALTLFYIKRMPSVSYFQIFYQ